MKNNRFNIRILSLFLVLMIVFTFFGCKNSENDPIFSFGPAKTPEYSEIPTENPTEPPITYEDITILSAGDIMFHMPQLSAAYNSETGKYSFYDNFQYVKSIISSADLSVVNFETTLADENYSGFPSFCSPTESLDAIKDAGFDVLLFANNHMYDRRLTGLKTTLQKFKNHGFEYLGATDNLDTDPSYLLVEVNGIKIGLLNYADGLTADIDGKHSINAIPIEHADFPYLSVYPNGATTSLFDRVSEDLAALKAQGAQYTICYMHWGTEYVTGKTDYQKMLAQGLCDLGIDAIIGSHPHVVEPFDVIQSTDKSHETFCFYSVGNYISNQNRVTFTNTTDGKNAENGITVILTIRKYSDGFIELNKIEYIGTWVHRYNANGNLHYEIIPLKYAMENNSAYGLTNSSFGITNATDAYNYQNEMLSDDVASYNAKLSERARVI